MKWRRSSADQGTNTSPPPAAAQPDAGRLHSWKEIASYLKHSVRTVQRWEAEGLPVHRRPHKQRDSVYAYPTELDAWWTSHQGHLEPVSAARRLWTEAVVVALVVLAAAAGWRLTRIAAQPDAVGQGGRGGRLTLLVSSANQTSDPAISGDAKSIVYVAESQGQADLYVARASGGESIRLTNDREREADPHFSPDGEKIVFTRLGTAASEICIIPTLGGTCLRLVPDAVEPAWSPDGTRVAFVSRRPGEADVLATVASDGSDFRLVLRSGADYPFFRHPAWSPDGANLAVERSTGGIASDLWLVPLNGGPPRRLSNDAPGVFSNHPVFTTDGRSLIHQSNRAGAQNLWSLPLDGSPPVQLTSGPGPDESPSVARDGAIAFESTHVRCELVVEDLASAQVRAVFTHSSYIWAPAFSPGGKELAFSRAEPDGKWHIWIVPVKGGSARCITSGEVPQVYPRFTPDGKSVIYQTWSAGADRIWRVSREGGSAVPLTPPRDDDDDYGDISPDGRWLAFARAERQSTRIYVAPATGGAGRRLTESVSTLPRWSPDNRWIAFSPSRGLNGGIFVIGTDGTRLRRLTKSGSFPVWWPDGRGVAYLDLGPEGVQRILSVPVKGGPPRPVGSIHFKAANNPFDISPDGRLVASSTAVDLSSEIWLLRPRR